MKAIVCCVSVFSRGPDTRYDATSPKRTGTLSNVRVAVSSTACLTGSS